VYSNTLTDTEKTLIPYSSLDNLYFIDENNEVVRASIEPRQLETYTERPGPESCDLDEYQRLTGVIRFFPRNFEITIQMETFYDRTDMTLSENLFNTVDMQTYDVVDTNHFSLTCESLYEPNLEEKMSDITISDFEFENVLVFINCDEHSAISRIICSSHKGVEFIEYWNGSYLKLMD